MPVSADAEFGLGHWEVTEDWVSQYLNAVGDQQPAYFEHRMAPPLALATWALGALLEKLDLPPGAVHSGQELKTHRGVKFGEDIAVSAYLSKPRYRGNLKFLIAGYTLSDGKGRQVQEGKSTVLIVESSALETAEKKSPQRPAAREDKEKAASHNSPTGSTGSGDLQSGILPGVSKTITQELLTTYAHASGDRNPLHLDADFAATTQFGGIIAHGMLTLAFIGEIMGAAYGRAWLETGSLTARFRGAAYLGDQVEAWGQVTKEERLSGDRQVVCSVGVRNLRNGEVLINGTATAKMDIRGTASVKGI